MRSPVIPGSRVGAERRERSVYELLSSAPERAWTRDELYEKVRIAITRPQVDTALRQLVRHGRASIVQAEGLGAGKKNRFQAKAREERYPWPVSATEDQCFADGSQVVTSRNNLRRAP